MWRYRRSYAGVGDRPAFARRGAGSAVSFVARALDFLFGVLYSLLVIRLVLDFVQARKGSGFYQLITGLSDPFYSPFRDIVRTSMFDATHPIVWSLLVAMVAYGLLHGVLRALLRLASRTA
jgi:uncharacterized protein YggT (Ycf19 family)